MSDARFLLWGGRASGKSGFLGALWHVAEAADDDRPYWAISPNDIEDEDSAAYLQTARADLLSGTRRPTPPSADYPVIRVTARKWQNRAPVAAVPLAFRDPAGEHADDIRRAQATAGQLIDDMVDAAGIIWLFDSAAGAPPELPEIVRQIGVLRQRNHGRPITTPVALCASKIDTLPPAARAEALRDPRAAVMRIASPQIIDQLAGTFLNHRFFAFTSKGSDPQGIHPEGMSAVLDWAFGEYRKHQARGALARHWRSAVLALSLLFALFAGLRLVNWYTEGPPAERRAAAESAALARLELARMAYRAGHMDSVVALLAPPELRGSHPATIDWDTLLAFAAYDAGFSAKLSGGSGDSLLALTIERTERALERVEDAQTQARIRYKRAEACLSVQCGTRRIRRDLDFVVANSTDAALVEQARERLAALEGAQ